MAESSASSPHSTRAPSHRRRRTEKAGDHGAADVTHDHAARERDQTFPVAFSFDDRIVRRSATTGLRASSASMPKPDRTAPMNRIVGSISSVGARHLHSAVLGCERLSSPQYPMRHQAANMASRRESDQDVRPEQRQRPRDIAAARPNERHERIVRSADTSEWLRLSPAPPSRRANHRHQSLARFVRSAFVSRALASDLRRRPPHASGYGK